MVLEYTKVQSTHDIIVVGEKTMTGSAVTLAVVDLTTAKYARGFEALALVIQNSALTGDVTITASISTNTTGTGTVEVLRTIVLDSADTDVVLEIVPEIVSHASDRSGTDVKSIIFKATGTNTDTIDVVVIGLPNLCQDGLTASDPTSVA